MQFGVSETLLHWGCYRPEAPAVCSGAEKTTYRQLNDMVSLLAAGLAAHADGHTRVAVAARQKRDLLAAIIAGLRAGTSVVVLNPALSQDSLDTNVRDTAVRVFVHDDSSMHLCRAFPNGSKLFNISEYLRTEGRISPAAVYDARWSAPEEEWGVLFSSGTTGTPKGIERTHESMVTELVGWCLELGLLRNTAFYVGRPIYYTGGLVLALSTLLVGGQVVVDDLDDEADFDLGWRHYQEALGRQSLDYAFFIPDQLRRFGQLATSESASLCARTVLSMGSPITGAEKLAIARSLKCELIESWGNSESLGTITEPEDLQKRPDSIGRPFLTDRLLIVDDQCNEVSPNQIGHLAGGEEAGFVQYSNRPVETQRVKREALIVSEDVGYQDDEGYFYVRGREQDFVLVGHTSVFLNEIELGLLSGGVAAECCVVAFSGVAGDVHFAAMVVPLSKGDPKAATKRIVQLLPAGVPEPRVEFVDALPRLPSGKVDRLQVRSLLDVVG